MEREFQEVLFNQILEGITNDENLDKFRVQYERLYRAFKNSFDNEKRLLNKCKELNDIILNNTAKIKAALDMSKEDANTIKKLQTEVDKAWKLIDQAKDKEDKAKKMITELKSEISNLNKIVDQGSGLSVGPDNTVHELMRTKDELKKQVEIKEDDIKRLREQISTLLDDAKKLSKELEDEKLKSENLLKEKIALEEEVKNKDSKIANQNAQYEAIKKNYNDSEKRKGELEDLTKKLENEIQSINSKFKEQEFKNKALIDNNNEKENEIKRKDDIAQRERNKADNFYKKLQELASENSSNLRKVTELENNLSKLERKNSKILARENLLLKEKEAEENEKKLILQSISNLEREVEDLKRENDMDKQQIKSLLREKDILSEGVRKASNNNEKTKMEADKGLDKILTLENEMKIKGRDIMALLEQKKRIELEKNKYGTEVAKITAKYRQLEEECKLKDNLKNELERKIQELKERLKEQQNLYEAVRSDRNLYSKNLIEAQDDYNDMKRKFKIATHQISQLKDEMDAKDSCLIKETFETKRVTKMNDQLKSQIKSLESCIEKIREEKSRYEKDIQKLNVIIKQSDEERKKLKQEYENAITERDIFGTQLIRRNDELALLYEKIKILQSTLSKGEVQYQERINDISILQRRCIDLQRELTIFKKQSSSIADYKKEIYHLEKELIQERLQIKALSEELETPINCHRWRKLEGTDPDTFEMIQKIQTLQKRLIKKTEEVVEKEILVQEKQKMIEEMQDLLRRQPGPEVAEQVTLYQQNLKEKTKQMKAMAAELNMYQAQVLINRLMNTNMK